MRYLIISETGEYTSIAQPLEREGHSVSVHVINNRTGQGTGLVNLLKTPRPLRDSDGVYNVSTVEWLLNASRPDITIFDSPNTHDMAMRMRRAGRSVLGTVSPKDGTPLHTPLADNELAIGFFNGTDLIGPSFIAHTYRTLFPNDIGPICPMTGFAMRPASSQDDGYQALQQACTALRSTLYRGPVVAQGDYAGPAWSPTIFGYLENLAGSRSDLFNACAQGFSYKSQALSPSSVGIRVSFAPWPYRAQSNFAPALQLSEGAMKHFWFEDMREGYTTTSNTNSAGFVTARGDDVREAARRAYRTVRNIAAPEMQYRSDIGRNIPSIVS